VAAVLLLVGDTLELVPPTLHVEVEVTVPYNRRQSPVLETCSRPFVRTKLILLS
jgi:hypothetical protein